MDNNKTTLWKIDPAHSEVNFKVRHMMISTVTGRFEKFDGKIEAEDDSFRNAQFTFSAEVASINTNNKDRDTHLRSDDFFGADDHAHLTFKSESFDGERMIGDITIKGKTQQIELEVNYNGTVTDPYGQTKAGFEVEGQLSRKDFGLTWNAVTEAGSVVVADKIKLIASLQYIKQ